MQRRQDLFKLPPLQQSSVYRQQDSIMRLIQNKVSVQPQKLITETNRLVRRGSQILIDSSRLMIPEKKVTRKVSQADCDIKNFFILDAPPRRQYRLQNFTDWVERIYGKDWFNI